MDLVKKIGDIVPFDFEWLVKDTMGRRHRSGNWNGMIGELLEEVSRLYVPCVLLYSKNLDISQLKHTMGIFSNSLHNVFNMQFILK